MYEHHAYVAHNACVEHNVCAELASITFVLINHHVLDEHHVCLGHNCCVEQMVLKHAVGPKPLDHLYFDDCCRFIGTVLFLI